VIVSAAVIVGASVALVSSSSALLFVEAKVKEIVRVRGLK